MFSEAQNVSENLTNLVTVVKKQQFSVLFLEFSGSQKRFGKPQNPRDCRQKSTKIDLLLLLRGEDCKLRRVLAPETRGRL